MASARGERVGLVAAPEWGLVEGFQHGGPNRGLSAGRRAGGGRKSRPGSGRSSAGISFEMPPFRRGDRPGHSGLPCGHRIASLAADSRIGVAAVVSAPRSARCRQFRTGACLVFHGVSGKRDQSGRTFGGSGAGEQLHGALYAAARTSGSALFRAASIAAVTAECGSHAAEGIENTTAGGGVHYGGCALCAAGIAIAESPRPWLRAPSSHREKGQHLCEQRGHRLDARFGGELRSLDYYGGHDQVLVHAASGFAPRRFVPISASAFRRAQRRGSFVLQDIARTGAMLAS